MRLISRHDCDHFRLIGKFLRRKQKLSQLNQRGWQRCDPLENFMSMKKRHMKIGRICDLISVNSRRSDLQEEWIQESAGYLDRLSIAAYGNHMIAVETAYAVSSNNKLWTWFLLQRLISLSTERNFIITGSALEIPKFHLFPEFGEERVLQSSRLLMRQRLVICNAIIFHDLVPWRVLNVVLQQRLKLQEIDVSTMRNGVFSYSGDNTRQDFARIC